MGDLFFLRFIFSLIKLIQVFWDKDYSFLFVVLLACTRQRARLLQQDSDLCCGIKMMFSTTAYLNKNKQTNKYPLSEENKKGIKSYVPLMSFPWYTDVFVMK